MSDIFICSASLFAMILLPFGIKGGIYHRLISSMGLLLYIVLFITAD